MKTFLIVILSFLTYTAFAQKQSTKFGKIEKADFSWTQYALDSNAHAVILYDCGIAEIDYQSGIGDFFLKYRRHLRIKILDKTGNAWANHSIPLWESGRDREKLTKFKAATYNLEAGRIVATTLDKKELLEERVHDNKVLKKIAMPNVKEGAIIEIEYTTTSPFYPDFVDWQFQYGIPVRYSEFRSSYPDWFDYKKHFQGYDFDYLKINEESKGNSLIGGTRLVTIENNWVAENMPALQAEPYTSNINNYMVKVDFELASYNAPHGFSKDFTNSWKSINNTLMERSNFGEQLTKGNTKFLSSIVTQLVASATSQQEKVTLIYQHLKEKVNWDERYGKFVTQDIKETYNEGKGNVADINLLLVAMLQKADFSVNPVILSTKSNGILNPYFPSSRQFDYVIAQVKVGDQLLLLDATEKDLPMNLLPARCLNDKGRLISKDYTDWVSLAPTASHYSATSMQLSLNESQEWVGQLKARSKDYAASQKRAKMKDKATSTEDNFDFAQTSNVNTENKEDTDKALIQVADITIDNVMDGGDLLYFNPMTIGQLEESPFKLAKRKYPIDFSYARGTIYSATFELPEGYEVEEVPEKMTISLPEKGGTFSYSIKFLDNAINVTSQIKIKQYLFAAEDYPALQAFYNLIVEKHAAQIVLRKKTE